MDNNLKRNLIESVNLQNCFVAIFPKMQKDPTRTFYKYVRQNTKSHYNDVANEILYMTSINLLKEVTVILNQIWKENPNRMDERLIKQKSVYNMIKSKISQDGKPLPFNTKELYKRIRQAISHNSSGKQNFIYNLTNFELNLGPVDGKDYIIELTSAEFNKLIAVLVCNMQNISRIQFACVDGEIQSRKDVEDQIKIYNVEKKEFIDLDRNQVERTYNYFRYCTKDKTIQGNQDVINKVVSIPNSPEALLYEKMNALKIVANMTSSSTWQNILADNERMTAMGEYVNIYFAYVSNMLFEIAASQTNAEIKDMLSGTGVNLNDEQIRHFRNALCHGRYFHDFDKTFYFYDGNKQLDMFVKLTIQDINKILDKVALGKHSVAIMK